MSELLDPGTTIITGQSGDVYETTIGSDIEAGGADKLDPGETGYVNPSSGE